ncbi:chemotaxis response regulator protein-glutamate methylesterase [Treponema parvum]|uniref:Protein-glutamate methylesterase/protein-glutamine glutaminase n=1 Tax=Treponema parvum TaxID=138851 RepID=A0A975F328_9SPIR|nr:chemotaxis response regulator protein-glutamate methylesterase [Treponema parvum]QTQ12330.1 chemotaxis response regulator protein-glutamate methylesterase [Treponema parvum]QTQ13461.1 chemotaxis response regulator protein-glutamate methylesterase [Treponema parvum]QTQ15676.1 chemotaxis response regulator protein-glutamate methylesterase [Treponema parvum]
MDDISVLVCDDSALMRNLISRIIDNTEGMKVCAKAMNGEIALERIPEMKPDIMVLDIEMPVMDGVQFLKERKARRWDIPVIILSSVATKGAAVTMQCLELGASDFITKPNGSISADLSGIAENLVEMLASYGNPYAARQGKKVYPVDFFHQQMKLKRAEQLVIEKKGAAAAPQKPAEPAKPFSFSWKAPAEVKTAATITPVRNGDRIDIIVIGISTGGPNALRDVFKMIDPHLKQPILVVQHMPAGFTKEFAISLNNICPLEVKEAEEGDLVQGGHVYIAPGDYQMCIARGLKGTEIRLSKDPHRNGHRPSVDYLFESVAKEYKNHALGVIMTGMGKDGAAQLAEMRKEGAWTLGQDQESSIVYGMPKVAWELGGVQKQVPLAKMADEISALAREHLT